ncbi:MAG TPA: hypothetical protein VH092_11025 [Urbifossiella sp.]|jgi:hypothetical protein|nr:hypothetical protein [Urbifossiella sp.]
MRVSCESADAATRAFIARMNDVCRPMAAEVTIPFYAEQFGKTNLCGSGVLLQIGERHFVTPADPSPPLSTRPGILPGP